MKIQIGDRIIVLPHAGYRNKYVSEFGFIERYESNATWQSVGVRLDNYTNSASSYGVFWFKKECIKSIENYESEDERIMLENYKIAGISFLEGANTETIYAYPLYDESINVDDVVVVQSARHGLGIAKIININSDEFNSKSIRCGRDIIAKVDFSAYEERKSKEKRIKELKKNMDAKVQELQNQAIYELLAEKDPTLKSMLDEFKNLIN